MKHDQSNTQASGDVTIPVGSAHIVATLQVPPRARALVAFAHGSGSSRFSRRNRLVAERLGAEGFATLLADLLSREEAALDERTSTLRFDIELLAGRVVAVIDWLEREPQTRELPLGLFGASTGAAAALIAAAHRPERVRAVVSRGGRPDLARAELGHVRAPTLLIVGGNDRAVRELNREAAAELGAGARLEIVPFATHLFEEPGALEQVAEMAANFFHEHLLSAPPR